MWGDHPIVLPITMGLRIPADDFIRNAPSICFENPITIKLQWNIRAKFHLVSITIESSLQRGKTNTYYDKWKQYETRDKSQNNDFTADRMIRTELICKIYIIYFRNLFNIIKLILDKL